MNPISWLVAALVITLAAALQSLTGFGFALVSTPLLLLVYDPHTAVSLNMMLSFMSQFMLTLHVHRVILRPLVRNLFLGSLVGIPLGIYAFSRVDVTALKLFISSASFIFSLLTLSGQVPQKADGPWVEVGIGSVSGFLGSSIAMPGPPVVLFLCHRGLPKDRFRATASGYFTLVYLISLVLFILTGAIGRITAIIALSLMPFVITGQSLGFRLFPYVPQAQFQKGVPLLVMAVSVYAFVTALM